MVKFSCKIGAYGIFARFCASILWNDESPIWVRMQKFTSLYFGDIRPYYDGRLQVVGHTPVEKPLYEEEKGLLTLDTFSTNRDGSPVGDRRFVVIDTKAQAQTFQYADEIIAREETENR